MFLLLIKLINLFCLIIFHVCFSFYDKSVILVSQMFVFITRRFSNKWKYNTWWNEIRTCILLSFHSHVLLTPFPTKRNRIKTTAVYLYDKRIIHRIYTRRRYM